MESQMGKLYVVATPIGNLQDISQRAVATLSSVDRILAEDTRHTQQLLTHLGIKSLLVSLHDHNEKQRIDQVYQWLLDGLSLALVSDAGTPLISDPGYAIVSALRDKQVDVIPIPGPCAIIAALSAAGLPTDRFCFEGFLPAKSVGRKKALQKLRYEPRTWVVYESSHRIIDCLADMQDVLGETRQIVIGREITKRFETFISGSVGEVLNAVKSDANQQRGEFVIMVKGEPETPDFMSLTAEKIIQELLPVLSTKDAATVAANLTGLSKKQMYQMALDSAQ